MMSLPSSKLFCGSPHSGAKPARPRRVWLACLSHCSSPSIHPGAHCFLDAQGCLVAPVYLLDLRTPVPAALHAAPPPPTHPAQQAPIFPLYLPPQVPSSRNSSLTSPPHQLFHQVQGPNSRHPRVWSCSDTCGQCDFWASHLSLCVSILSLKMG